MSTLNQVTLIGNLGKDPELKNINGKDFINFSIATSKKYKKGDEWVEQTEWHNVTCWREHTARFVAKWAKKGTKMLVVGELQTRKYDKDGVDHYATSIVVGGYDGDVKILSGGRSKEETGGAGQGPDSQQHDFQDNMSDGDLNDEIPF